MKLISKRKLTLVSAVIVTIMIGTAVSLALKPQSINKTFAADFIGTKGDQPVKMRLKRHNQQLSGYIGPAKPDTGDNYITGLHHLEGQISANNEVQMTLYPEGSSRTQPKITGELVRKNGRLQLKGNWQDPQAGQNGQSRPLVMHAYQVGQDGYKLISHYKVEQKQTPCTRMSFSYPWLKADDAAAGQFNERIKSFIKQTEQNFIATNKKLSSTKSVSSDDKRCNQDNRADLTIDYTVTSTRQNVISILFRIKPFFPQAAHGSIRYRAFNYDLVNKQFLQLGDIFAKDADYLTRLKTIARNRLAQQLARKKPLDESQKEWLRRGTEANISNYENWNIRPDGLLFNFGVYQVAPFAYGPVELHVPVKLIDDIVVLNDKDLFEQPAD